MRSPSAVAGALVLLLGVPVAFFAASFFEDAAEIIIHFALGGAFALFAHSALEFGTPRWAAALFFTAIGVLAAVFLAQGVADLLHSAQLRRLGYDVLGQRLEKILGYAFLLWCVVLLALGTAGKSKLFGAIVLTAIMCVELYSFVMSLSGGHAPEALKLLYLPLFLWLLLEGAKPRHPAGPQREQD